MTPARVTLRLVRPDDGEEHPETTRRTRPYPGRTPLPRRRRILLALAVVWLVMAGLAGLLVLLTGTTPSTPLGDTAAVPGGVVRISAVIPLESDGWVPPSTAEPLTGPVRPGAHRVRILLEMSAPDAAGLVFHAADFSLSGLGVQSTALWVDPVEASAGPGTSVLATLVFEIPNEAIALVLDGPHGVRLSLGTAHHTGA